MEVRADKFLSGHYAYFAELPERDAERTGSNSALELEVKKGEKAGSPAPVAPPPVTEYKSERDTGSSQYQH